VGKGGSIRPAAFRGTNIIMFHIYLFFTVLSLYCIGINKFVYCGTDNLLNATRERIHAAQADFVDSELKLVNNLPAVLLAHYIKNITNAPPRDVGRLFKEHWYNQFVMAEAALREMKLSKASHFEKIDKIRNGPHEWILALAFPKFAWVPDFASSANLTHLIFQDVEIGRNVTSMYLDDLKYSLLHARPLTFSTLICCSR